MDDFWKILMIAVLLTDFTDCQLSHSGTQTDLVTVRHRKLHLRRGSTAVIGCRHAPDSGNRSRSLGGVQWYRNGKPLVLSGSGRSRFSEVVKKGRFTLTILDVREPDQGTYTCNRRKGKGTILIVGDTPVFVVGPRSISPPHGVEFEVKCFATGTPTPQIRIFKDAKEITKHSRAMFSGRAVNISVIKATILACQAENIHGFIWKNATLIPQGVSDYETDVTEGSLLPLVLGGIIGFLAVLTIFLVAIWFHLRRTQTVVITKVPKEEKLEEGAIASYKMNGKFKFASRENSLLDLQYKELEVKRDRIEFMKAIVEGSDYLFSHGYLFSERPNGGKMAVTIKSLKKHTSDKYIMKEVLLLRQFHNHNVLRLTATCTLDDPQTFVFEHCPNGDLKTFLRNRNPKILDFSTIKRYSQLHQIPFQNLGLEEKLQIAWQICKGMRYLEESNYLHRDLAARNCLVSETMSIKVSDIGLGLEAYPDDYNLIKVEENSYLHLPLRWTSPESIEDSEFTFHSSVWSFGVVLWEIFSYARQPFSSYNQEQVIQSIKRGRMLPRPHKCPRDVYTVIKSCWNLIPEERPPFDLLEKQLCAIQNGTQV